MSLPMHGNAVILTLNHLTSRTYHNIPYIYRRYTMTRADDIKKNIKDLNKELEEIQRSCDHKVLFIRRLPDTSYH